MYCLSFFMKIFFQVGSGRMDEWECVFVSFMGIAFIWEWKKRKQRVYCHLGRKALKLLCRIYHIHMETMCHLQSQWLWFCSSWFYEGKLNRKNSSIVLAFSGLMLIVLPIQFTVLLYGISVHKEDIASFFYWILPLPLSVLDKNHPQQWDCVTDWMQPVRVNSILMAKLGGAFGRFSAGFEQPSASPVPRKHPLKLFQ